MKFFYKILLKKHHKNLEIMRNEKIFNICTLYSDRSTWNLCGLAHNQAIGDFMCVLLLKFLLY